MQKKVLTSDGYVSTFDKQKIIDEIRKNCKSMGVEVTEKQLTKIATNTEESIKEMKPKHLTGSLIRSVSLIEMLDLGLEDVYKACAKVGMPIADMMAIWQVDGDSVHDNANLDGTNQETQHKRIADHICKEAVLQMLPSNISKLHIDGNLHCLSGDMPIVYKIQNKIYISTIKELVEAKYDSIVSVPSIDTRTKKISWKPITRFIKNPSSDLYKVTFGKGRYIICTMDHPFYKTSGQHIQHHTQSLSDLRVGHRIATLNHIPTDDVQNETYRGNLIGFFLGDGSLQHGCISFHLKKIEKISYLINVLNHLDKSYDMINNTDGTVTISFKDDELCEIWNNSKNISNFNEVDATGILSGLINSDASIILHGINKLPYLEFGNTNEDIINLYHCLMMMHGINVSYQRYDKKSDAHKDFYHCVCSGEDVTNLLRKLRLRKPFVDLVVQQFTSGARKKHTWSQIPIKSIEYYGNEETYDITVDGNHNFLAGYGFILSGNCHDMEYFTNRQFCADGDLRYILYYGLIPDGVGRTLPVARAAQSAEVAFLHAAKSLGSSQGNCAGGQGWNSFNVLISPYLYGKPYEEIKQLAQMFIYEMGQMTCSRGGQATFSSIQLYPGVPAVWKDKPVVYKGKVWNGEFNISHPLEQITYKWSFGGKTGDGRLFFNRKTIVKNVPGIPIQTPIKTYRQYDREARLLFKAFMEIYAEGDIRGRPFTFPKAEVVFSKEFMDSPDFNEPMRYHGKEWFAPSYKEQYQAAIKLALINGTPYFESQYHEENPLNSIRCVQCCSYGFSLSEDETTDFSKMMNFVDGYHIDSLGSMQVVSLNLPRAAYTALESDDTDKLMAAIKYLRDLIDHAVELFEIKRNYIKQQASPYMRQQPPDPHNPTKKAPMFFDLDKLSYIVGLVGLNEFVQALTGFQLHESEEAVIMGERLIGSLNLYCGKVGHEHGMTIALARTPAETTAQRFAVQDLIKYPKYAKKYVKGNLKEAIKMLPTRRDVPIQYSNGTHLAVDAPVTLDKKIEIEGRFFGVLKGGNIFHVFLDDVVPMLRASELGTGEIHSSYVDDAMEFVFKTFRETPINYLAITKDSTICDDCNSITPGVNEKCPKCGSTNVDFFSRITGYLEPISQWNAAKKQEFFDRHRYGEKDVRG